MNFISVQPRAGLHQFTDVLLSCSWITFVPIDTYFGQGLSFATLDSKELLYPDSGLNKIRSGTCPTASKPTSVPAPLFIFIHLYSTAIACQ